MSSRGEAAPTQRNLRLMFRTMLILIVHNHSSGAPQPSESDIKVSRDPIRAGQFLKIEILDHVIVGRGTPAYSSLCEAGVLPDDE